MRIVLISDTHGFCPEVPDGDVLIHAGDLSLAGSFVEIEESGEWFSSLPHKRKILIAGNHDWLFQRSKELALSCLEKVIYLENSSVILDGIKFYGSPVQPEFNDWAFNVPRGTAIKNIGTIFPMTQMF